MKNFSKNYYQQVSLLIKVLPYLNDLPCFALKGGTAINFFYQNMPRLSVDIDLCYLPLKSRQNSLLKINNSLSKMAKHIKQQHPEIQCILDKSAQPTLPKLQIQVPDAIVKVEVSPVFRGTVFPVIDEKPLCDKAQSLFESYLTIKTLSLSDLYAGKFCAALNRQHPRDLFDVKLLLETEGLSEEIRQAFIVYLAGDRRPFHELLNPNIKPYNLQKTLHENEFSGMASKDIAYQDLAEVVENLAAAIRKNMTSNEKQFLMSLVSGKPNWELMPFTHLKELPALQWKLLNINNMNAEKRKQQINSLEAIF